MKRLWFLLILLLAVTIATALVAGCGDDDDDDEDDTGDDDTTDDDDDNDDTTDDDDSTDDDDDATGGVTVSDIQLGTCGDAGPDYTKVPLNIVEAKWENDTLTIYRKNAEINCEPDLSVEATLEGGVLTITETDDGQADCICATDVQYNVNDIPASDEITLKVQYTALKGWNDIAEYIIETNGDDYAYKLPNLELIVHDATYPANSPMAMTVNACHLEDYGMAATDPLKLQIYSTYIHDGVAVYTIDRRNLTDPGTIGEFCTMIDWNMPGLPAGTYPLVGPGYDDVAGEYIVWEDGYGGLVVN